MRAAIHASGVLRPVMAIHRPDLSLVPAVDFVDAAEFLDAADLISAVGLTFADGFTDRIIPSVIPLAGLTVNRARHRTELRFESLGDSVGIFIGESVTSPYGADVLNPSVMPSVKNTRNNLHVSEPPFFFILNIPSVIPSVYTDGIWPNMKKQEKLRK